jgi:PKHD-type hydroxylase
MLPFFSVVEGAVSLDACQRLIDSFSVNELRPAGVGGGDSGSGVARDVRDVRKVQVAYDRGIGAAMSGIGLAQNHEHWRFDITHSDQCDLLRYDREGHYEGHIDSFFQRDVACRKLSVLLFLNDDFAGGKFYLLTEERKVYPIQRPGTVVVFPSFMVHGVEPVTDGLRFSLITWLVGPWFR